MRGIQKLAYWVCFALEALHWIGAALSAAAIVCALTARDWLCAMLASDMLRDGGNASTYGFELALVDAGGAVNGTAVLLFAIGAFLITGLFAMIFRDVRLILRNAHANPFTKDNIRMLREIGIFSISAPVVGLIMSLISRIALGVDCMEGTVEVDGLVMGLLMLCLTQILTRGAELQRDVDGLV